MLTGTLARRIAKALHTAQSTEALLTALQEMLYESGQSGMYTLLFTLADETAAAVCGSTHSGLKTGVVLRVQADVLRPPLQTEVPTYFATPQTVAWGDEAIQAAMIAPLWADGACYGALLLHEVIPREARDLVAFIAEQLALVLSRVQFGEALQHQYALAAAKLHVMAEMGQVLRELNLDVVLAKLMELALTTVAAEVGCIVLRDPDDPDLACRVEWGLDRSILEKLRLRAGETLVEAVMARNEPCIVRHLAAEQPFAPDPCLSNIDSLLAWPLCTRERVHGCLVAVNLSASSEQDIELLRTVVELSNTAIENAFLHQQALEREGLRAQLRIAGEIQRGLLPTAEPQLRGVQVAAWNMPCEESGGDYYDFFQIDAYRVGFVVGDAAGHGIGAALIATTVRAFLRALVAGADDLDQLFTRLNDLAEADFADNTYMTLFFGIYDTRDRTLTYASAGHRPPLLIYRHTQDAFEHLTSTGIPLGIFPRVPYGQQVTAPLEVGDLMLLLTDGIDEAPAVTGERFGMQRLLRIIRTHSEADPARLIAIISTAVHDFTGTAPRTDDITLLCLRVTAD
jgi:phosphoserine phosphatase RsbU/P